MVSKNKKIPQNIFKTNRKGVSTIIILSGLLLISIIIFSSIFTYFNLTLNDFEISNQFINFKDKIEILEISGNFLEIKNSYRDNLIISSIQIGEIICPNFPQTINRSTTSINIGTCTQTLNLEEIYPVIIITSDFKTKLEYEILHSLS